jgi:hypothetical protein
MARGKNTQYARRQARKALNQSRDPADAPKWGYGNSITVGRSRDQQDDEA